MENSYTNKIEVAAALYLASDAAKFTTGSTLLIDGGLTAQ
jgi:NAD(P)-dependent dehydrogenase (short-subunit alcohol dehydrogenase family)